MLTARLTSKGGFAVACLLLATAPSASAHPGWGLVRDDARGLVYYTDLVRVWKIDREGRRSVAVPDVHTHELMLDEAGNLYGEDLEGVGGGGWRNRIWRLSPDGRLEDVIPWRSGYRDDYGFVKDGDGALYWASCVDMQRACVVKRRAPDGTVSVAGGGAEFARPLNFLAPEPGGRVLLADGRDVKRITAADVAVVAAAVGKTGDRFAIMGMYAAADRSVYAAAFEDRIIVRVAPDGTRQELARSDGAWQPTGVLRAPDGLWVLEADRARTRLRWIGDDRRTRVYDPEN
jgi:hypothetical protein